MTCSHWEVGKGGGGGGLHDGRGSTRPARDLSPRVRSRAGSSVRVRWESSPLSSLPGSHFPFPLSLPSQYYLSKEQLAFALLCSAFALPLPLLCLSSSSSSSSVPHSFCAIDLPRAPLPSPDIARSVHHSRFVRTLLPLFPFPVRLAVSASHIPPPPPPSWLRQHANLGFCIRLLEVVLS